MIYQFPTNRTIESAFRGEPGSSLESYIASNLPTGKLGKLVELAIEIESGTNNLPFINTKVPIGKRDRLIEICFTQKNTFFVCCLLMGKSDCDGPFKQWAVKYLPTTCLLVRIQHFFFA